MQILLRANHLIFRGGSFWASRNFFHIPQRARIIFWYKTLAGIFSLNCNIFFPFRIWCRIFFLFTRSCRIYFLWELGLQGIFFPKKPTLSLPKDQMVGPLELWTWHLRDQCKYTTCMLIHLYRSLCTSHSGSNSTWTMLITSPLTRNTKISHSHTKGNFFIMPRIPVMLLWTPKRECKIYCTNTIIIIYSWCGLLASH